MRFTLEVRMVDERDLCSETRFLPDDDEYETYLTTLGEELSRIDTISQVWRNTSSFCIETSCTILVDDLKRVIKPALVGSVASAVRFVSLVES